MNCFICHRYRKGKTKFRKVWDKDLNSNVDICEHCKVIDKPFMMNASSSFYKRQNKEG